MYFERLEKGYVAHSIGLGGVDLKANRAWCCCTRTRALQTFSAG